MNPEAEGANVSIHSAQACRSDIRGSDDASQEGGMKLVFIITGMF